MREPPEDGDERSQAWLRDLNAQPWQVELLDLNPDYPHWGPGWDFMDSDTWGAWTMDTWSELAAIDTHFECVHFYFSLSRESVNCAACSDNCSLVAACEVCESRGFVFTKPSAYVSLTLWMIYPRKGASAGCHIKRIEQDDLPAVMAWLASAAASNADRFAGVVRWWRGMRA